MASALLLITLAALARAVPQAAPASTPATATTYTVKLAQLNQAQTQTSSSGASGLPEITSLASLAPSQFVATVDSSDAAGATLHESVTVFYNTASLVQSIFASATSAGSPGTSLSQEATCTWTTGSPSATVVTPKGKSTPLTISGYPTTCVETYSGSLDGSAVGFSTTSTALVAPATFASNGLFDYVPAAAPTVSAASASAGSSAVASAAPTSLNASAASAAAAAAQSASNSALSAFVKSVSNGSSSAWAQSWALGLALALSVMGMLWTAL